MRTSHADRCIHIRTAIWMWIRNNSDGNRSPTTPPKKPLPLPATQPQNPTQSINNRGKKLRGPNHFHPGVCTLASGPQLGRFRRCFSPHSPAPSPSSPPSSLFIFVLNISPNSNGVTPSPAPSNFPIPSFSPSQTLLPGTMRSCRRWRPLRSEGLGVLRTPTDSEGGERYVWGAPEGGDVVRPTICRGYRLRRRSSRKTALLLVTSPSSARMVPVSGICSWTISGATTPPSTTFCPLAQRVSVSPLPRGLSRTPCSPHCPTRWTNPISHHGKDVVKRLQGANFFVAISDNMSLLATRCCR